ncbi:Equilibrative nucleoside transporter, partial [Globisporangium splendens]
MLSPLPQTPSLSRKKLAFDAPYDVETGLATSASDASMTTLQEAREEALASYLFALVGIGYLFPFSALTQPVDYWKMLFPDYNIEFALTSTFMYTNLGFLALIVVLLGKPWYTGRIVGGFLGQLVVLAFIPTSYFFLTSESANAVSVLGGTAAVAIATAFIDSSTIALVSQYPLRVQESFQLGVGLSSLIGSFYRDLTKLVFPVDELVASTLIYFYTGALTIALCILAYFKVVSLRITKKYVTVDNDVEMTETSHLLKSNKPLQKTSLVDGSDSSDDEGKVAPTKWSVLGKVYHLQILITLMFVCSLSLWPPLVTEIKTYNFPSLQASGWWSLILLTTFSIWDCVGRFMVRHRFGLTPQNIWIVVLARFLLIPIIVGIVKGYWLTSDWWSLLFVSILGHTNGYVGTLTIIFVNESVHQDEQQLAGPFTSFFLNLGLVLGASAGLVMEKLVLGQ